MYTALTTEFKVGSVEQYISNFLIKINMDRFQMIIPNLQVFIVVPLRRNIYFVKSVVFGS